MRVFSFFFLHFLLAIFSTMSLFLRRSVVSKLTVATAIVVIGPQSFHLCEAVCEEIAALFGITHVKPEKELIDAACNKGSDLVLHLPASSFKKVRSYFVPFFRL